MARVREALLEQKVFVVVEIMPMVDTMAATGNNLEIFQ
jgi:hypothetical protein